MNAPTKMGGVGGGANKKKRRRLGPSPEAALASCPTSSPSAGKRRLSVPATRPEGGDRVGRQPL